MHTHTSTCTSAHIYAHMYSNAHICMHTINAHLQIYTSQKERDKHTDRDGEADTGTQTQRLFNMKSSILSSKLVKFVVS